MYKIFLFSCLTVICFSDIMMLHATDQREDLLIYNSDTFHIKYVNENLELFDFSGGNSPLQLVLSDLELFKEQNVDPEKMPTNCYRGYVATWVIKDSCLYLSDIKGLGSSKIIPAIEKLLKRQFVDGVLKADWVTAGIYSREERFSNCRKNYFDNLRLIFTNGKIISSERSNQTYCALNGYANLNEFFYSNIKWNRLPVLSDSEDIIITYCHQLVEKINGKTNRMTSIICSDDSRFNKEIVRVAGLLPICWAYENGHLRTLLTYELHLSNRLKSIFDLRQRK